MAASLATASCARDAPEGSPASPLDVTRPISAAADSDPPVEQATSVDDLGEVGQPPVQLGVVAETGGRMGLTLASDPEVTLLRWSAADEVPCPVLQAGTLAAPLRDGHVLTQTDPPLLVLEHDLSRCVRVGSKIGKCSPCPA